MKLLNSKKTRAYLLLAPLILFVVVFFLWPLLVMMKQSISDDAVSSVLKETASVIHEWDEKSPPTAAMQQAFIKDIQTEQDPQAIGNMIRKLNSEQAGFRTLYLCTDSVGLYERYGFAYLADGYHPWGETSRIYQCSLPAV